jgi:NAD(P)-dependent dehydrogenase (short-subunit alcohol dehydrogenase family)
MAPLVSAKHGLEGLSGVMRLEFRQLGIRVAVIEPGFVGTAMGGKLRSATPRMRSVRCPTMARTDNGPAPAKVAEEIAQQAASGSPPEVVAEAVLHALTSKRPHTRYPSGAGAAPA